MFSVALSVRSPCLDVIQHPALWSSDFPQAANGPAITRFALAEFLLIEKSWWDDGIENEPLFGTSDNGQGSPVRGYP
jgi:hypothetical protein